MKRKHSYPDLTKSLPTPTPTGMSNIEQSQLDTISSLIFAGHDTTANTLTWCCYELAKQPAIQDRLRADIDRVIDVELQRPLTYDDLSTLPYLTRVLHETLRLWPIVHYGTFRELVPRTGQGCKRCFCGSASWYVRADSSLLSSSLRGVVGPD